MKSYFQRIIPSLFLLAFLNAMALAGPITIAPGTSVSATAGNVASANFSLSNDGRVLTINLVNISSDPNLGIYLFDLNSPLSYFNQVTGSSFTGTATGSRPWSPTPTDNFGGTSTYTARGFNSPLDVSLFISSKPGFANTGVLFSGDSVTFTLSFIGPTVPFTSFSLNPTVSLISRDYQLSTLPLNAVPEPATLFLLGAGLSASIMKLQRRRRK